MGITNSQYQELMREYDRRQAASRRELQARRAVIDERVPQLAGIEQELVGLAVAEAKARLQAGTADGSDAWRQKRSGLMARRHELLAAAGFSEEDLEPRPQCPDCKDTGFIGNQKCHCFRQAEIDLLYTQSRLRRELEQENFESFDESFYSREKVLSGSGRSYYEQMRLVLERCRAAIERSDVRPVNLFLSGPAGTGKTFLTHCLAKELIERCRSVVYLSAIDFFDLLSSMRFERDEEENDRSRQLLECDVLIIDDLGTELMGTFASSQLFYCLNDRAASERSTIISSNLSLNDVRDRYTERVSSRIISDYEVLVLMADDIRVQKRLREAQKR